jgi:ABC-type multidrug transport system fused ATPase/permease subunit
MPVPVAVTNPYGAGLQAATLCSVETAGPFARLKAAQVEPPKPQEPIASTPKPDAPEAPMAEAPALGEFSLVVEDLQFSYPGLGEESSAACMPLVLLWTGSTPKCPCKSLHVFSHSHFLPSPCPLADGRPVPGVPPLIRNLSFALKPGSRCLLLGANGAGKTTFLKVLGGKHMVPEEQVRILGGSPFHDTMMTTSGDLAYVGGTWSRDIAFAGCSVPLTVSITTPSFHLQTL